MQLEHPRRNDESGAALVLAIAFVFVFSIILTGVLGLTDASLQNGLRIAGQRDHIYAADGALEAATNHLRHGGANLGANFGGSCFPDAGAFIPPVVNGVRTRVECVPEPDSGLTAGNPTDTVGNTPPLAIHTTHPAGGTGLRYGPGPLAVYGNVYTEGDVIRDGGARLEVTGEFVAGGSCPPQITVTERDGTVGAPICNSPGNVPAAPVYAPPLSAPPTVEAVLPGCGGAGRVVAFEPGWYRNAAVLNQVTSTACGKDVYWFKPGVYYLDFPDDAPVWNIAIGGSNHLVAGTPLGWNPATATASSVPAPDDSDNERRGCDSEHPAGVVFVLSGASRIKVDSGQVQLCAPHSLSQPKISVHGLGPADAAVPTATTVVAIPSANPTSATTPAFVDPARAQIIEDGTPLPIQHTTATLGRNQTATLRAAFTQALPANVVVERVRVRTVHRESDVGNRAMISGAISSGGQTQALSGLTKSTTWRSDWIDVSAFFAGANQARLADFAVTFTGQVGNSGSGDIAFDLDGIAVEVVHRPVALRAQTVCSTASCAFLDVAGNDSKLVAHGTVYAPRGTVYLNRPNTSVQVLRRGAVVRSLLVNLPLSGSGTVFPGGLIGVPIPGFTQLPREVTLTAYCVDAPGSDPCVEPTRPLARTRVWIGIEEPIVTRVLEWRAASGGLSE